MTTQLSVLATYEGRKQHLIADFGVGNLAGILRANYPRLSPEGAQVLAQIATLGGSGELVGVHVKGAAADGARALCPHCGWETPLRRVRSREDFSEYVQKDRRNGFIDPRDIGAFQNGRPLYFKSGVCDMCGENLANAVITGVEA